VAIASSDWADLDDSPMAALERTVTTGVFQVAAAGTLAALWPSSTTTINNGGQNPTPPVTPVPGGPVDPGTIINPANIPGTPQPASWPPVTMPTTLPPGSPVDPGSFLIIR